MTIAQNLHSIRTKLPDCITLVAVSKFQDEHKILQAIKAGQRVFGENRVQESQGKWPGIKAEYPDIELHLIGPLQTNKVKEAVALFDYIQTLDRTKLADCLMKEMQKQGKTVPCLIQVNVGKEPQKAGIMPEETDSLIKYCQDIGLPVRGFMCIPPAEGNPEPHFHYLKDLASGHGLEIVSMGMSGDYETAIKCGATHVRVGTAVFGERDSR